MLAVCSTSASLQMIASLGNDFKPLAPSPSPVHVELKGDVKEPIHYSQRVRNLRSGAVTCHTLHTLPKGWVEVGWGL